MWSLASIYYYDAFRLIVLEYKHWYDNDEIEILNKIVIVLKWRSLNWLYYLFYLHEYFIFWKAQYSHAIISFVYNIVMWHHVIIRYWRRSCDPKGIIGWIIIIIAGGYKMWQWLWYHQVMLCCHGVVSDYHSYITVVC